MTTLCAKANAKLNLTLDVLGLRDDGYHDLCMVMQEISLGDEIALTIGTGKEWEVRGDCASIPLDKSNLACRAASAFFSESGIDCGGLSIEIVKRTPVCAGMGGGSADGAAVLRLLQEYYNAPISETALYRLAEETGSDVPFALFGGTALAREKGQVLTRVPALPPCLIVLCKPCFPISTPALFRAVDRTEITRRPDTEEMIRALQASDLKRIGSLLCNVFEPIVEAEHPELSHIRSVLISQGALGASMTGSGPTMFALFDDRSRAEEAARILHRTYPETFLTEPVYHKD